MNDTPTTRRRKPWKKIVISVAIFAVVSICATIALLPQLLGTPPGRRWLLKQANQVLAPGGADFQEIALSWTRPTELKGVVLTAPNGDRVVEAPAPRWIGRSGEF